MAAKLVHRETAREIQPGATLHGCAGAVRGQAWRFEEIKDCPDADGTGTVHVSRTSSVGRAHRNFPPHMFNTKIVDLEVSVTFKGHVEASAKQIWSAFVTLVVAGIVAYIVAVGMEHMLHG